MSTTPTVPSITAESRLAQGYRSTMPVSVEATCCAALPPDGVPEVFTIATDGSVVMFQRSPDTASGWRQTNLGGDVTAIRVVTQPDGSYLLFGTTSGDFNSLRMRRGTPSGWDDWTDVFRVDTHVTCFAPAMIDGTAVVGLGTSSQLGYMSSADGWQKYERIVDDFAANQVQLVSPTGAGGYVVAATDGTIVYLYVPARDHKDGVAEPAVTAMDAVAHDGRVELAMLGAGGQFITRTWLDAWIDRQTPSQRAFRSLALVDSRNQRVDCFLLDATTGTLNHSFADGPIGTWHEPVPLGAQAYASIAAIANGEGDPEVFAVGVQGTLDHWKRTPDTGDWEVSSIELSAPAAVESFTCYEATISARDAAGAPWAGAGVTLSTAGVATMVVDGKVCYVDAQLPVTTTLDALGQVHVQVATRTLAVPELHVVVSQGATASLTVQLNATEQTRLAHATAAELTAAFDFGAETAEAVAGALGEIASLGRVPTAQLAAAPSAPDGGRWWSISFDDGTARFERLAAEAGQQTRDEIATRPTLGSILGIDVAWGDLWSVVESGVATIAKITVHVVEQAGLVTALKSTFDLIVNGAKAGFEASVHTVERCFDFIEGIFREVAVGFDRVFAWLGFVFDWAAILRTREAFSYVADQFLTFLGRAAPAIGSRIDAGFDGFKATLGAQFTSARARLGTSLAGAASWAPAMSPDLRDALGNNVVFRGLLSGARGASSVRGLDRAMVATPPGGFAAFAQTVAALGQQIETQVAAYFASLGTTPDQILGQTLTGLVDLAQSVTTATLGQVQGLVDQLIGLAQSAIDAIRILLVTPMQIPLVSELYQLITGGAALPSMLEVMTLVLAIPATAVYTAANGAAPFSDAASVAAFKRAFGADSMLTAAGLAASADAAAPAAPALVGQAAWTGLIPKQYAPLLATGAALTLWYYGQLTAVTDTVPMDVPVMKALSVGALVNEVLTQALSFPWFYAAAPIRCGAPDAAGPWLWIYMNVGVLLDMGFLGFLGHMPENGDDAGVLIVWLYSVFHIIFATSASQGQDRLVTAANFLPVIPEFTKPLRLTDMVAASQGRTLIAQAAIDFVAYTAAAVTGFAVAQRSF